jgi:hypothetical protein
MRLCLESFGVQAMGGCAQCFSATGNSNDHTERSCSHCRVDCGGVAHRCADRPCHLPLENMVRMLRHSNRGPHRGCHSPYRLVYVNSTGRLRHRKASQISREKNDGFRKGSTHPTDCDRDPTVKLIYACPPCGCHANHPARYSFSSRNATMTAIACCGCSSMIQWPELPMTALRTLAAAKPTSVANWLP